MTKNRTYLFNDKGSFAVIFAVLLPVLILLIGVSVDMSRYNIIKSKFNGALDGAVLAASTVVETQDAELVANNFFKANFPEKYMNTLTLTEAGKSGPVKITVKKIKEDGNNKLSVKGEVKADLNFMFSNALGLTARRISHVSKVERIVDPNVEIVLTVDVSPSMCTTSVRSANNPVNLTPDSDCKKLKAMKKAMKNFVNHIFANSAIDTIKIGIVPYNHKVIFPDLNKIPPTIASIEPADYYKDFSDASPLTPIVPLTSDKAKLLSAIDSINLDINAKGWTRTTIGTHAAALMLDPSQNQYFGGDMPKELNSTSADKVIVQMTDGANVGCCYGNVNGDFTKQYQYLYKSDMDYQKQFCELIKKSNSEGGSGIVVFSVVFDVDDGDFQDYKSKNIVGEEKIGGKWIKNVFSECASNDQFYFDVSTNGINDNKSATDLEKVYAVIAQYFYQTRIVE